MPTTAMAVDVAAQHALSTLMHGRDDAVQQLLAECGTDISLGELIERTSIFERQLVRFDINGVWSYCPRPTMK